MMRGAIPCVEGKKIKKRKGDLTGEMDIICFPVVKHVKQGCELVCPTELQPVVLAQASSLAPSGGLHYINCSTAATPGPLCPGEC